MSLRQKEYVGKNCSSLSAHRLKANGKRYRTKDLEWVKSLSVSRSSTELISFNGGIRVQSSGIIKDKRYSLWRAESSFEHSKTQYNTIMKSTILSSILLLSSANGWTTPRRSLQQRSMVSVSAILKARTETTNDPCWQDLSDDDCAMEKVYASYFVVSEWIKSMPCASGLDVSVSKSFLSK